MKKAGIERIGKLGEHHRYTVIGGGGTCPTIMARDYKGAILVLVEVQNEQNNCVGNNGGLRKTKPRLFD